MVSTWMKMLGRGRLCTPEALHLGIHHKIPLISSIFCLCLCTSSKLVLNQSVKSLPGTDTKESSLFLGTSHGHRYMASAKF